VAVAVDVKTQTRQDSAARVAAECPAVVRSTLGRRRHPYEEGRVMRIASTCTASLTAGVVLLFASWISGCAGAKSEIEASASLLCQYNQLEGLAPEILPDDVNLDDLVRQADLAYAKQETNSLYADLEGNPFAALGQAMAEALTSGGKAMMEASAANCTCQVTEICIEGDTANASVTRTSPNMDEVFDSLDKMGELNQLGTHEERVAKAQEWFASASTTTTTEHSLRFQKAGERWVAVIGLPEQRLEEIDFELNTLKVRLDEIEQAREQLAQFEVVEAKYYKQARRWGRATPVIDLKVRNGTPAPVSRAYFHGVVKSPERSIPWIEEDFNYKIAGGLEPGEEARWKLSPNMFSEWGTVDVPKEAEFTVTVVGLDGANEEELFSVRDADEVASKIESLNSEATTLRAMVGS